MNRLVASAALAAAATVIVACSDDREDRGPAALSGEQGYQVREWTECPADFIDSGSWDQSGNLYVPCGPTRINVYDTAGARTRQIETGRIVSDVAPSPDGRYLYLALGRDTPRRMIRQADGSYQLDQTWRLATYSHPDYGSGLSPRGHFIATDGAGDIYLADGAWTEGQGDDGVNRGGGYITVIKYSPAGSVITRFGTQKNSWERGFFHNANGGVVATADGSRVYTTELNNSRIQRWDRQPNGSYVSSWTLGSTQANDPNRAGGGPPDGDSPQGQYSGRLAAPYDVALDDAGNLYVLNTTMHQVLKFSQDGELLYAKTVGQDATSGRPHSFAVSKAGDWIYVHEDRKLLAPPGSNPAPPAPSTTTPSESNAAKPTSAASRGCAKLRARLKRVTNAGARKRLKAKLRALGC